MARRSMFNSCGREAKLSDASSSTAMTGNGNPGAGCLAEEWMGHGLNIEFEFVGRNDRAEVRISFVGLANRVEGGGGGGEREKGGEERGGGRGEKGRKRRKGRGRRGGGGRGGEEGGGEREEKKGRGEGGGEGGGGGGEGRRKATGIKALSYASDSPTMNLPEVRPKRPAAARRRAVLHGVWSWNMTGGHEHRHEDANFQFKPDSYIL